MRFGLLSGGCQGQSSPGFGQRLKFIEFDQVGHGFARDQFMIRLCLPTIRRFC